MRKKSVHAPRPGYQDKCNLILKAVRRLMYNRFYGDGNDDGFTMAMIAEEAGYARSARFMDTLHCMVSEGLLVMEDEKVSGAMVEKRYRFHLPSSVKQQSFVS